MRASLLIPPKSLRRVILYGVLLMIFLPAVQAYGELPRPSVEVIPENVSVNGSFILKINPNVQGQSLLVKYATTNALLTEIFRGSVPRTENGWACVFSNDASVSTCGPTPFMLSTNELPGFGYSIPTEADCEDDYESNPGCLFVETVNVDGGRNNATRLVQVGGIKIDPKITLEGTNASILVSALGFPDIFFSVYARNLTLIKDYQKMTMLESGYYSGYINLEPGDYYVVFRAKSATDSGGTVYNLSISSGGTVIGPDNSLIVVDPVDWNPIINKSRPAERGNFKIVNRGTVAMTNLSVRVPKEISDYVNITLASSTLPKNDQIYFTATIEDIETSTTFNSAASLYSNSTKIATILIKIMVSVRDECEGVNYVKAPEGVIELDSYTWEGSYLTGKKNSKDFTIRNRGTADITGLSYIASSTVDGVIGNVTLPAKIEPGKSGKVSMSASSSKAKSYYGSILINTSLGVEKILVGLTFMEDISTDLDSLASEVTSLDEALGETSVEGVSSLLSEIRSKIDSAKDDIDSGDYSSALDSYNEARFKYAALSGLATVFTQPAPTGDGGATTTVIIILVIVVAGAFGAWYYFTKMKQQAGEPGSESKIKNEDELDF